jgi:hypothetical protein
MSDVRLSMSDVRCPMSAVRCPRFRRLISRFLASYSGHDFRRLSTVVHTVFQRVFSMSSCCEHTYLAQSPQCSTCSINMNDNNLRGHILLRGEFAGPTLRTPRSNVFAAEPSRDHRRQRRSFSTCICFPALAPLDRSKKHRAHRCVPTPHRSGGKAFGATRTRAITSAARAMTAAKSGFVSRTRGRAPAR